MKKLGWVALFLLPLINGMGQFGGLKFGYNAHFTRPEGLNQIVDLYNATYDLNTEMKPFTNMDGLSYGFMAALAPMVFDIGYNHRSQNRFALGTINGQPAERRLRAAINSIHLGMSIGIASDDGYFVTLGGRLNVGKMRVRTKVGLEEAIRDQDWEDLYNELYMDLDVSVRFATKFLSIEPFYVFSADQWSKEGSSYTFNNIAAVNETLNNATGPDPLALNNSGFGIRVELLLLLMID